MTKVLCFWEVQGDSNFSKILLLDESWYEHTDSMNNKFINYSDLPEDHPIYKLNSILDISDWENCALDSSVSIPKTPFSLEEPVTVITCGFYL